MEVDLHYGRKTGGWLGMLSRIFLYQRRILFPSLKTCRIFADRNCNGIFAYIPLMLLLWVVFITFLE